jgi:hypothetical protein
MDILGPYFTEINYDKILDKIEKGHFPKNMVEIDNLFLAALCEEYKLDLREIIYQIVLSYLSGTFSSNVKSNMDNFFSRNNNNNLLNLSLILDGELTYSKNMANYITYPSSSKETTSQIRLRKNIPLDEGLSPKNDLGIIISPPEPAPNTVKRSPVDHAEIRGDDKESHGMKEVGGPRELYNVTLPNPDRSMIESFLSSKGIGMTFNSALIVAAFTGVIGMIALLGTALAAAFSFMIAMGVMVMSLVMGLLGLLVLKVTLSSDIVVNTSVEAFSHINNFVTRSRALIAPPVSNSILSAQAQTAASQATSTATGIYDFFFKGKENKKDQNESVPNVQPVSSSKPVIIKPGSAFSRTVRR